MNHNHKINQLRTLIESSLLPIIDRDYVLYDLPYHSNIGDILIWEGELALLNKVKHKCLDTADNLTCTFPSLSEETIILFHGGGNFGDLYHEHVDFLIKLTQKYSNNKIIVFPQTVFYNDNKRLEKDIEVLSEHSKLTICVRDFRSKSLLEKIFKGNLLLLPDMAFCIPKSQLCRFLKKENMRTLFIKRVDPELKDKEVPEIPKEAEVRDWPTFEGKIFDGVFIGKVLGKISRMNLPVIDGLMDKLWDFYAFKVYRKDLIKIGVRFMAPYKFIYSTRLHGAILGIMLEREVWIIDNSYQKNSTFYRTWLEDLDKVTLFDQK